MCASGGSAGKGWDTQALWSPDYLFHHEPHKPDTELQELMFSLPGFHLALIPFFFPMVPFLPFGMEIFTLFH